MKKIKVLTALLGLLILVGCEEDYADYTAPDQLSDVSWIVSLQQFVQEPYNIHGDSYLSFFDLSQGDVSHQWIVEEGNYFLKEGFSTNDSLPLFINNDLGLFTDQDKAHVLFRNSGINTVRLLNKFSTPVNPNFSDDYLDSDNIEVDLYEENGLHVVDTKFIFDVYGKLEPAFKVYKDDVEILSITEEDMPSLDDMDTWPEIEIEAASSLKFVDLTTEDRPNNRQWLFADGVPNQTNQEEAIIKFYRLGTFTGSMRSMRLAPLPADSETKLIPLKVKVLPSTLPFVYDGILNESEDQIISFRVNGEVLPFTGEEGNFTVHVTNTATGFDMEIPVQNARVSSENPIFIELALTQPIYNTDDITISYSGGGGIISADNRQFQDFGPVGPVVMHLGDNVLSSNYGFEVGSPGANFAFATGYWVGNGNTHDDGFYYERVTSRAESGVASMKYETTDATPFPTPFISSGVFAAPNGIPAGNYRLSLKLFITTGSGIKGFRTIINQPNWVQNNWDIENEPRGEWIEVSQDLTLADIPSNAAFQLRILSALNAGVTGAQEMYIDNISFVELEQRQ